MTAEKDQVPKDDGADRRDRLAERLRDNLKRRKEQARARGQKDMEAKEG